MVKFFIITATFFVFLIIIFVFWKELLAAPPPKSTVWVQTDYWFRKDDGNEQTASGWGPDFIAKNTAASLDSPVKLESNRVFRLRIAIRANRANGTTTPRLDAKLAVNETDINCTSGDWFAVNTGQFLLWDSTQITDGAPVTQQITSAPGFIPGFIVDKSNPAPSLFLNGGQKTEYEWSFKDVGEFKPGSAYVFRVTNNGVPFNNYDVCPTWSHPLVSRGGTPPTAVYFSGRAYPGAEVVIIAKDPIRELPIKSDIVVSPKGDFAINFGGIISGVNSYGLVVKDKEKRTTQTKFYNLNPKFEPIIEKDIFIPPTIGFVRPTVSRGDLVTVVGYGTPESSIETEVDGNIIDQKADVQPDGSYKISFNTGELDFGSHAIKSRQEGRGGTKSDFSPQKIFVVSKLFTPKTDLNNDGIIDIKDLSIFLSRWQSKDESLRQLDDLNGDGKIDIKDFSIFIRTMKKY